MSPHSVAVVKIRSITIVRPLYIKSKPCWIQYAQDLHILYVSNRPASELEDYWLSLLARLCLGMAILIHPHLEHGAVDKQTPTDAEGWEILPDG